MRNNDMLRQVSSPEFGKLKIGSMHLPRRFLLGIILILALIAFEAFNFDTTRYALQNLLGDVRFAGFAWATILAIAFCAIDFAGLARLLTPERGKDEPKEIWYLTGAWLLGATMNAVMTWWAVSTVLLNHELGNEVLSRDQLIHIVPVFVAILVWLTRILFIGAITMAGERLLHTDARPDRTGSKSSSHSFGNTSSRPKPAYATQGAPSNARHAEPTSAAPRGYQTDSVGARKNRRPPRPQSGAARPASMGIRASNRNR